MTWMLIPVDRCAERSPQCRQLVRHLLQQRLPLGPGQERVGEAVENQRSISARVKPSSRCASQYSSVRDTPVMSQPSVQSVTTSPAFR